MAVPTAALCIAKHQKGNEKKVHCVEEDDKSGGLPIEIKGIPEYVYQNNLDAIINDNIILPPAVLQSSP